MSKDRLLSDEELKAEYLRMFRVGLEPLAKVLGSQEEHFDELVKALAKVASVIANTQKRLYAESVIGGDETLMGNVTGNYYFQADKDDLIKYGNKLRAEQRERLK